MTKLFTALAASLLTSGAALATPVYMPTGAQANVAFSTVTAGGWTQCYSAAMAAAAGYPTPLGEAALVRYRQTITRGWSALDDAAVLKTYLE